MRVELAINPFDADVRDMVAVAQAAEAMGVSAVWVADHFSGAVVNRRWSRDPFVVLGAIAARTTSVHLGVLVANMMNRHVAHLASSLNTLQSVAPDRVRCGIGSGAAPNSQFAVEQDMVGTQLGDLASRRTGLVDTIEALRVIWSGGRNHPAAGVAPTGFRDLEGVVVDGDLVLDSQGREPRFFETSEALGPSDAVVTPVLVLFMSRVHDKFAILRSKGRVPCA